MFENITKGKFDVHKYSKTTVQREDGRTVAACAGYSTNTDNGEHITENTQNTEFICFCFNLQQKYDIGLLSVAVDQLQKILDYWDSGNFTRDPQMWKNTREILKNIKQNK